MPSPLPADETTVVVVGTTPDPEPIAGRLDTGVHRCESPDEVVAAVAELPVQCLVVCTDSLDATEATGRLAAEHPSLPLVAYASSEDPRVATEVVAAGADEYVAAPAEDEPGAALVDRIRAAARETGYERPLPTELFEAVGDPLIVHGVDDDTILDVNERFCELLGYERTELLGRSIAELTAEAHVDADPEANLRRAVERGSYTFEWADRDEDGSVVPVEVTLTTFERDGNQRVLASLRDISERKRRSRRLSQLHEAATDLLYAESVDDIAEVLVDIVESVFDEALVCFWQYDDVIDSLDPVAASSAVHEMEPTAGTTGELPSFDPETLSMDVFVAGESRLIDDYGTIAAERAASDAPLGTVLMLPVGEHGVFHVARHEVVTFPETERSQLELLASHAETALDLLARERELERQNERLERFRSTLAHDLRDPLNTAKATLALLGSEVDSEYVSELESLHDRMARIVDDVLALTRTEEIEAPDPVGLEAVARDVWETAGASAEEATLTVAADATVRADRGQLERLLANLFGNAVEHAGPDVSVTVDTCEEGFYVADDGPGIPEDEREAIFESGASGDVDGTGLGLSIVREVTALHGWTVRATESDDGGLRIEVTGPEEVMTA